MLNKTQHTVANWQGRPIYNLKSPIHQSAATQPPQTANNDRAQWHPCGRELQRGLNQCSAQQFRQFFEGETRDLCTDSSRSITGVEPGTNQWARPPVFG
jgi:hypothetical protein